MPKKESKVDLKSILTMTESDPVLEPVVQDKDGVQKRNRPEIVEADVQSMLLLTPDTTVIAERISNKYNISIRQAQRYIANVKKQIVTRSAQNVDQVRDSLREFIIARIGYCIHMVESGKSNYESHVQNWVDKYMKLYPNQLMINDIEDDKTICVTFNKISPDEEIVEYEEIDDDDNL